MNANQGKDKKKFQFIQLQPDDLEPPASIISDDDDADDDVDEWTSQRKSVLGACELWMDAAFQAQRALTYKLVETGGIAAFQTRWVALASGNGTHNNNGRAASLLAQSALETSQAMKAAGFTTDDDTNNMMSCAYEQQDKKNDNDWPTVGILFPELSEWVLAPANAATPNATDNATDNATAAPPQNQIQTSCDRVTSLLEREAPVLLVDKFPEAQVVDQQSWDLFLAHGRLCESPPPPPNRQSEQEGETATTPTATATATTKLVMVRDTEMRPTYLKHGSCRLFVLSTFLAALVDLAAKEEVSPPPCACCERTGNQLLQCSRCHCLKYCSRECQLEDYKHGGHREACRDLQKLRDRYSQDDPVPKTKDAAGVVAAMKRCHTLHPQLCGTFLADLQEWAVSPERGEETL